MTIIGVNIFGAALLILSLQNIEETLNKQMSAPAPQMSGPLVSLTVKRESREY